MTKPLKQKWVCFQSGQLSSFILIQQMIKLYLSFYIYIYTAYSSTLIFLFFLFEVAVVILRGLLVKAEPGWHRMTAFALERETFTMIVCGPHNYVWVTVVLVLQLMC